MNQNGNQRWRETYQDIMASGLWSVYPEGDDPYFTWKGCDAPDCPESGKGTTVYDIKGYRSLEAARNNRDEYYTFRLCGECLNREVNGEV